METSAEITEQRWVLCLPMGGSQCRYETPVHYSQCASFSARITWKAAAERGVFRIAELQSAKRRCAAPRARHGTKNSHFLELTFFSLEVSVIHTFRKTLSWNIEDQRVLKFGAFLHGSSLCNSQSSTCHVQSSR